MSFPVVNVNYSHSRYDLYYHSTTYILLTPMAYFEILIKILSLQIQAS